MEKAFVCRFYGWTPDLIQRLPFSVYSTYFKSAVQLKARESLDQIQFSSFVNYKAEVRDKIVRALKSASSAFEERRVKDYREVLSNLARGLAGG